MNYTIQSCYNDIVESLALTIRFLWLFSNSIIMTWCHWTKYMCYNLFNHSQYEIIFNDNSSLFLTFLFLNYYFIIVSKIWLWNFISILFGVNNSFQQFHRRWSLISSESWKLVENRGQENYIVFFILDDNGIQFSCTSLSLLVNDIIIVE